MSRHKKSKTFQADYGLYNCEAYGKMILGFEKEGHPREQHKGRLVNGKRSGELEKDGRIGDSELADGDIR